jgi:hypothetical protein
MIGESSSAHPKSAIITSLPLNTQVDVVPQPPDWAEERCALDECLAPASVWSWRQGVEVVRIRDAVASPRRRHSRSVDDLAFGHAAGMPVAPFGLSSAMA